jgi:hypothetical protein
MRLLLGAAGMLVVLGCGRGSAARERAADSTPPAPKAPAPHVGRDSAFGPTFTVDSTGKVTPIVKKKP